MLARELRVLLVDDNPFDRELASRALRREFANLRLDLANDRPSLDRALGAAEFDVVITDYQLLWTNGLAVLREVRLLWPDCPVIMFTATGNEELAVEAMKAGLSDYVVKSPKHFGRLPSALRSALERARQRRDLRMAEIRYASLFERVPIGLYRVSTAGELLDVNPALVEMLDAADAAALISTDVRSLFAEPSELEKWYRATRSAVALKGLELRLRSLAGRDMWVRANIRPVVDADRHVTLCEGSLEDITDRKVVEMARERLLSREQVVVQLSRTLASEINLTEITRTALDEIVGKLELDAAWLWLSDQERMELRLLDYAGAGAHAVAPRERIPLDSEDVIAEAARTRQFRLIDDVLSDSLSSAMRLPVSTREFRSVLAMPLEGTSGLVGVVGFLSASPGHFTPDDLGLNLMVAELLAFAIEKARLHQDLRNQEHQVSLLLEKTIDLQEEERERICLEIHDGVAQTLSGAYHYLQALDATQPRMSGEALRRIQKVADLIQDANREAREVISGLRPAALDALGLVATLRYELDEVGSATGLRVVLEADQIRYPKTVETALYRIIHEAITNVRKHAQASEVVVRLRRERVSVIAEVQDDGIGLDPPLWQSRAAQQSSSRAVGMVSMRKRSELLQGTFEVVSERGRGTLVRVRVPLSEAEL